MTTAQAVKVKEVAFTTYPVTDMARARKFYEGVLGFPEGKDTTGDGGNSFVEYELGKTYFSLGHMPGKFIPTKGGPMVGFEVEDFEAAVEALKANNTEFLMAPFDTPVCQMAMIVDTEGNSLMIHKLK